jgi:hypothetical protein
MPISRPTAYAEPTHWPAVSVIVPFDDPVVARKTLTNLVDHPYPGEIEILLVGHDDGQAEALAEAVGDTRVAVVHAPHASRAARINAAAFSAKHSIVSRAIGDVHYGSRLLRRAVAAMQVTGADVVGGSAVAIGLGSAEKAASAAMNSRLGVGPRPSRVGAGRGPVDSVRMVAIRREAFERAGGLNEDFGAAQDWELQHRVRRGGGMVWLDPGLAVGYHPTAATRDVAGRFFRTGAWRRKVLARYPETQTWRYVVPPILVAALALTMVAGIVGGALGVAWMWALAVAPFAYALAVGVAAAIAGDGLGFGGRVRMWWTVMAIHLSWGAGFLFGRGKRHGED